MANSICATDLATGNYILWQINTSATSYTMGKYILWQTITCATNYAMGKYISWQIRNVCQGKLFIVIKSTCVTYYIMDNTIVTQFILAQVLYLIIIFISTMK